MEGRYAVAAVGHRTEYRWLGLLRGTHQIVACFIVEAASEADAEAAAMAIMDRFWPRRDGWRTQVHTIPAWSEPVTIEGAYPVLKREI